MDFYINRFRNVINGLYKTLHKTLHNSFEGGLSLSMTEMQTIGYLSRNEKAFPSDLATLTKITMPSMSQILKKLEVQNIIKRTPSAEDGRKVYVILTHKGTSLIQNARTEMNAFLMTKIETKLTKEEVEILKQAIPVLEKLNAK